MKKKLPILLTLILTLVLCVCGLFACDKDKKINWSNVYTLNGGTITGLTEYGKTLTELVVPETIDGVEITKIDEDVFKGHINLLSVTIEKNVREIDDNAFANCYRLVEVINNSTYITIEKGSKNNGGIGFYALEVFNSGDVYIDKFINNDDFIVYDNYSYGEKVCCGYVGTKEYIPLPTDLTAINNYAFFSNDIITGIDIPNGVTRIGDKAFYECSNLRNINMPDSLTSIGDGAFGFCTSLTNMTIPNSVTSIGDFAFNKCSNLARIMLPSNLNSIGDSMFSGCEGLESMSIPSGATSIGDSAFSNCDSLEGINIPDSVTTIGVTAFYNCDNLSSVTIGSGVTSIGKYAFYGCTALTELNFNATSCADLGLYDAVFYDAGIYRNGITVTFGEGATRVPAYLFYSYEQQMSYSHPPKITSVTIGNNVKTIGENAFYDCGALASVCMGNNVESIGTYAFGHCSGLGSIIVPNSVGYIGSSAFSRCSNLTIYCQIASEPSGWHYYWNLSNCPVVWGYNG